MRKRIFISGPISRGDLCHNINQATAAFVALAKAGFAPMCPHWSVYSKPCVPWMLPNEVMAVGSVAGNPHMTHADWMAVDLPWVGASDALLRLPGESVGADMEVKYAREVGVPVFANVDSVVAYFAGKAAREGV